MSWRGSGGITGNACVLRDAHRDKHHRVLSQMVRDRNAQDEEKVQQAIEPLQEQIKNLTAELEQSKATNAALRDKERAALSLEAEMQPMRAKLLKAQAELETDRQASELLRLKVQSDAEEAARCRSGLEEELERERAGMKAIETGLGEELASIKKELQFEMVGRTKAEGTLAQEREKHNQESYRAQVRYAEVRADCEELKVRVEQAGLAQVQSGEREAMLREAMLLQQAQSDQKQESRALEGNACLGGPALRSVLGSGFFSRSVAERGSHPT
eukprot:TRINITY_DN18066_c0_g1_i7.p1 TRINITY_DN18066_c0_g1~~TRINITY_DN18066_c0_g1_i7.p1  ORF type:complete len:272 (-),score=68.09 TRINITY_DN18066_c0_g1_i7:685-1500(-)